MSLEDIQRQYCNEEPSSKIYVYGEFTLRGSEDYDEDEPYIFFVDGILEDGEFDGYFDNENCPEYIETEFCDNKEKYINENIEKLRQTY